MLLPWDGGTYYVSADMKFKEWKKGLTGGDSDVIMSMKLQTGASINSMKEDLERPKHDKKIMVTDKAPKKVELIEVPEFTGEQNKKLQKFHREILLKAKDENNSNEVMCVWDIISGESAYAFGTENQVSAAANPFTYSLWTNGRENTLACLHNHPTSASFSFEDIKTFILEDKVKVMSVVTNQGAIDVLAKTGKYSYKSAKDEMTKLVNLFGGDGTVVSGEFIKEFSKITKKIGVVYVRRK